MVVTGRQPHPQKPRVAKNAAAEFVDAEIASRRLAAKNSRHAGRLVFSVVEFFHPKGFSGNTPGNTILTAHHEDFAVRSFTTPANTLIRNISPSEVRHRMHQAVRT